MTGFFDNVLGGMKHEFTRIFGSAKTAVVTALGPSFVAVEAVAKAHGEEFLGSLVSVMAGAALDAVTGGAGTVAEIASAAGKAAISAGVALAEQQGKAVAADALHAIATAQVTAAQAAAPGRLMTELITALAWALRLVGLVSAAEKLWAAHQATQTQQAAAEAQKATIDEDERKLAIAAQPDRSIDDVLDRMQRGQD